MSINIRIKQKGLIKKELPLRVIVGDRLEYGVFDGLRTDPGKSEGGGIIVYDPEHIVRGIGVDWKAGERDEVSLHQPMPSSARELHEFYRIIERIGKYWRCDIYDDNDELTDLRSLLAGEEEAISGNRNIIACIFGDGDRENIRTYRVKDPASGERELVSLSEDGPKPFDSDDGLIQLYCVMHPVFVGAGQKRMFAADPDSFGSFLHEKQAIDAYYAKPHFYRMSDGIVGRYVITVETRSIFPKEPFVPLNSIDPETDKMIECDGFGVVLYSAEQNAMVGEAVAYDKFIAALPPDKVSDFDGGHILIEPIGLDEWMQVFEKRGDNE